MVVFRGVVERTDGPHQVEEAHPQAFLGLDRGEDFENLLDGAASPDLVFVDAFDDVGRFGHLEKRDVLVEVVESEEERHAELRGVPRRESGERSSEVREHPIQDEF